MALFGPFTLRTNVTRVCRCTDANGVTYTSPGRQPWAGMNRAFGPEPNRMNEITSAGAVKMWGNLQLSTRLTRKCHSRRYPFPQVPSPRESPRADRRCWDAQIRLRRYPYTARHSGNQYVQPRARLGRDWLKCLGRSPTRLWPGN